nr:MAG: hypothetical protein [Apis mellifera filamentous virus]
MLVATLKSGNRRSSECFSTNPRPRIASTNFRSTWSPRPILISFASFASFALFALLVLFVFAFVFASLPRSFGCRDLETGARLDGGGSDDGGG